MAESVVRSGFVSTLSGLWRRPGYSLTVIATLALGIGAATAVFALVHGILLSALPFPQAERLIIIRQQNSSGSWNTSVADFQGIAAQNRAFESVAAMRAGDALVGAGERAQWVSARYVTARYFDVMGVAPARGRVFVAGEDEVGGANTVVLSHGFAEQQFAGRGDPVGQTLQVDGKAHTVVGVMPAGVESWPTMRADLWPVLQLAAPERRGPFFLTTLARMKPEVTLSQATADLEDVSRRIFPLWQQGFNDETARLTPFALHGIVTAGSGAFLWVAFGAVGVVLLIALVNNANLMLMRIAQRGQDLGVRAALGATRWRLARLLMSENLMLVALGAGAGLGFAALLLAQYRALGPALPRLAEVSLSADVVAFTGLLALISALVFSLLPLAVGAVGNSSAALRQARGASTGRDPQRIRDGLVVMEFALALPLLIAAGLLVASLVRLQRVDPGFDASNLLTANVRIDADVYADDPAQIAFWERVMPALRNLPGVEGVALSGAMPPSCGCFNNFDLVGRPAPQGNQPQSSWVPVDAGWFDTLGVRLLEGRLFDTRDTPDSPPVLIVTESWAKRYFPGETAVGKELHEGGDTSRKLTVIGVVSDVKFDSLQTPGDTVLAPVSQGWGGNALYVILRTATDPLAQAQPLQRVLRQLDSTVLPAEVQTMETLLGDSLGAQRHWATVIAGFALSAVLLAAVGVFGVLAHHVANRQREIGIRQALGADARSIVGMVLARGLKCAALGIVVGSILAAFVTKSLEALLFEIDRADPSTWLAASALLMLVGAAACWLPAQRAARADPLQALRQE